MNDKNWLEELNPVEADRQRWQKLREAEAHRRMLEINPDWKPVDKSIAQYWREFRAMGDKP